jgi:serine protease Do
MKSLVYGWNGVVSMKKNVTISASVKRGIRAKLLASAAVLGVVGFGLTGFANLAPTPVLAQSNAASVAQTMPTFADIVAKVRPAVVSVKVKLEAASPSEEDGQDFGMPDLPPGHPLEKFFKQFREQGKGSKKGGPKQFGMAQGSGFFISADGYLVTNNHVVENAVEVTITTDDGKTLVAKIIGRDPKTDLALLKTVDNGPYAFVTFASTSPRVGDWVVAVGNPFGLGGTVTAGIVSARGRDIGSGPYDDYIQIDAPVNRGNSGGPTFNLNGEVVGVNTAIYSPSGGSVGIAFAIPSETVASVIGSLKDGGSVARGYLGVQIQPVTQEIADSMGLSDTKGALVAEAQPGTPAADAGLKPGDTITAVNGEAMASPREVSKRISQVKPGDTAKITFIRAGKEMSASVKLASLPDQKVAAADPAAVMKASPAFGLTLAPAKDGSGVLVTEVDPSGTGSEKGMQKGDVILEIGGKPVSKPSEVRTAIEDAKKDGRKAIILRVKNEEGVRFVALAFPKV